MATPRQAGRVSVNIVATVNGKVWQKTILVPKGQTVGWALNACGLYQQFEGLRGGKIGIWGKFVSLDTVAEEGDRIEVYVPVNNAAVAAVRG